MKDKILLVDGNSLLFRSFYATAKKIDGEWISYMKNSEGEPTNAVKIFINVLNKIIKMTESTKVAVAFDSPVKTFRHDYDFYKSKRSSTPNDLKAQFSKVKKILDLWGIKWFEIEGLEADDIIGSICNQISGQKYVLTGDKDLFQLINDDTFVYYPDRETKGYLVLDNDLFAKKFEGLKPTQIIDLKSLMGDSSDNIPGVPRIGEKTSYRLLNECKDIEEIYNRIESGDTLLSKGITEKLLNGKEMAFISKSIVKIITDRNIVSGAHELEFLNEFSEEFRNHLFSEGLNSTIRILED